MKSKAQTYKLSCCKMKISITLNFPEMIKELNTFDKGVEGRVTSGYKPRGGQKSIESKDSQSQLNPNALEFKGLPARYSTASSDSENEYILPGNL